MKQKKVLSIVMSIVTALSLCGIMSPMAFADENEEFFTLENVTFIPDEEPLNPISVINDDSVTCEVSVLEELDGTSEIAALADSSNIVITNLRCHEDFTDPFATGQTVLFLAEIYNTGTVETGTVKIKFNIDGADLEKDLTLATLQPNKGRLLQINLRLTTDGWHNIKIKAASADSSGATEKSWIWQPISSLYDVAVTGVECGILDSNDKPGPPFEELEPIPAGVKVGFSVRIANYGKAVSGVPIKITMGSGGEQATIYDTAFGLGASQGGRITFSGSFNREVDVDISTILDASGKLSEWNRVNNRDTTTFSVVVDKEAAYGSLDFHYPLPSQYTQTYDYGGHLGLDLHALEGTDIYSVDDGYVELAGGADNYDKKTDSGEQRGYFVVVRNDTNDPYNGNSLITRYLHMYQNPDVTAGETVSKGETLGGVGKTGKYEGPEAVDHLHIDFNSSNIINTGMTPSAYIRSQYFWPDVNFTPKPNRDALNPQEDGIRFDSMFEDGRYYDGALINYIGLEQYEAWWDDSEPAERSVYKLIADFHITDEQLQDILHESIYDIYLENWPQKDIVDELSSEQPDSSFEMDESDNQDEAIVGENMDNEALQDEDLSVQDENLAEGMQDPEFEEEQDENLTEGVQKPEIAEEEDIPADDESNITADDEIEVDMETEEENE